MTMEDQNSFFWRETFLYQVIQLIDDDFTDEHSFIISKFRNYLEFAYTLVKDIEEKVITKPNGFELDESISQKFESSIELSQSKRTSKAKSKIFKTDRDEINNKDILKLVLQTIEDEFFFNKTECRFIAELIRDKSSKSKHLHKVFLSYAYEDKLYTLLLYIICLRYDIELHIDWMHNDDIPKCAELKKSLKNDISKCSQFLFLDTPASQLNVKGYHGLRQWCAWEVGIAYCDHKLKLEKYFLDIYPGYTRFSRLKDNRIMDTFHQLKRLENRRLI